MTNELYNSDRKMLELIDALKKNQTIKFDTHFCNTVGLLKQNLLRIKMGLAHFTAEHIEKACISYNVNANWIFGIEKEVFYKPQTLRNTELMN